MIASLTAEQRRLAMADIPLWNYDPSRLAIHRQFRFSSFPEALAAMISIGFEAERINHHPEWANVYDRLDIWLTTHDASGVSTRDIDLALFIDAMSLTSI